MVNCNVEAWFTLRRIIHCNVTNSKEFMPLESSFWWSMKQSDYYPLIKVEICYI